MSGGPTIHVIESAGPGGAETVLTALVSRQRARGEEVLAVVPSEDGWLGRTLPAASRHILRATPRDRTGIIDGRYLRELRRLFAQRAPAIVHAHSFDSAFYCALALLGHRARLVVTFHGASDVTRLGAKNRLKWLAMRRAQALVCVSASLRATAALTPSMPTSRLRTILNGADIARMTAERTTALRQRLGIPAETTLLGALGNIRAPKGYDLLLTAIAELRSEGLDVHLAVAGDERGGLAQVLRSQRTALGLERDVTFLGFVDEPAAFLGGLDLFVLSSTSEGFSLATVQAMAAELPIVATRSGGPQELITHDEQGWLVEAGSSRALVEGIRTMLSDAPRRARLARAARERALGSFSLESMLERYAALYAELLRP